MKHKKAQVEVTFHWVYILIAGAIILLFFAGIVVKGKATAEKNLENDVIRIMESILVGAGAAEKTKNFVETEGLSDYVIEFKCEGNYAGFGIKGGAFRELPISPVFAPSEIKTTELILWSLPYKLPYKVMDMLMVTSINTKYFVIGDDGVGFRSELEKSVDGLNFVFMDDLEEIDPGKNFQVRIVDLEGGITDGDFVPDKLPELGDRYVTAVSFSGSRQVNYFQQEGNQWKRLGEEIQIISIAEEKDAAKYAAIFSGDGESYKCNMMKAFKRMEFMNEVYDGKLDELLNYYEQEVVLNKESCQFILEEQTTPLNIKDLFKVFFKSKTIACSADYVSCPALMEEAVRLRRLNGNLARDLCISLY